MQVMTSKEFWGELGFEDVAVENRGAGASLRQVRRFLRHLDTEQFPSPAAKRLPEGA